MISPILVTAYAFIPMLIALIGGLLASIYLFRDKLMNSLQYFVAGIIIAVVAIELLPEVIAKGSPWSIGLGFILGTGVMLGAHQFSHFLSHLGRESAIPIGMIIGVFFDLFIDGLLIGTSFLAGKSQGILIGISLGLSAFFLVMTLSSTLIGRQFKKNTRHVVTIFAALMLPIGSLIGSTMISQFASKGLTETLAFGVGALLFLGIEVLLTKVCKTHKTIWISSCFFLGFLAIILFKG